MDDKQKRQVGWAFIATLITISVILSDGCGKKEEVSTTTTPSTVSDDTIPSLLTPVEEYPTEEEVNEVHPAPVKDEKAEVETVDVEIQHFTDDGTLIAPYPDYDNFADAFVYARRNLGWEEVTGEVQTFLWRGKKYHTEHKDQLHSDSTESDTATVNQ